MDSRWYGIIIILIIGISLMYAVVSSSTTVGSAVIIVNDVSVTLPHNFKILHNNLADESELQNRDNNETIFIKYICDGNNSLKEFRKEIKNLTQNDTKIIKNTTDRGINTIYCKNYTLSYFEKWDRTILIKMSNYTNKSKEINDLNYIIDSIEPDFKQNRS